MNACSHTHTHTYAHNWICYFIFTVSQSAISVILSSVRENSLIQISEYKPTFTQLPHLFNRGPNTTCGGKSHHPAGACGIQGSLPVPCGWPWSLQCGVEPSGWTSSVRPCHHRHWTVIRVGAGEGGVQRHWTLRLYCYQRLWHQQRSCGAHCRTYVLPFVAV